MPIDLALVISIIALIPIFLYLIQRYAYAPGFFFRIGGEQSGEPIIVSKEGRIYFGISAESKLRSFISEVWVYFDPSEVDLSKTKGAEKRTTAELHYLIALYFSGTRVVKDKIFQGFFWEHKAISSKFNLKFIAYGQIDETETPFHDMFPVRKLRHERLVKFEVQEGYQSEGFASKPGEVLHIEGVQAQEEVWASSDKPGAQLQVFETLKE